MTKKANNSRHAGHVKYTTSGGEYAPQHTDFIRAFSDGAVFHNEWSEKTARVRQIAKLVVPTGRIIAGDPSMLDSFGLEFARRVTPGKYPVVLSIAEPDQRVACSMVVFRRAKAIRWELATARGQELAHLKRGQIFGYGVDAGIGSFADAVAVKRLGRVYDWFEDVYCRDVLRMMRKSPGENWGDVKLSVSTSANLVACSSGWGDGLYASYWGFDRDDSLVHLVTDFGVFGETIDAEVVIDRIPAHVGSTIQTARLKKLAWQVGISAWRPGTMRRELRLAIAGAPGCQATLVNRGQHIHWMRRSATDDGVKFDFQSAKRILPDAQLIIRTYAERNPELVDAFQGWVGIVPIPYIKRRSTRRR